MDIDLQVGAELAAAGRTLGMSPDEVMQYVLAKKKVAEKKAGKTYSDEEAFESFINQINRANEALGPVNPELQALDKYYVENEAGGGNQDQLQMFLPGEEANAAPKRDPNAFKKVEYQKTADGNRRRVEREIILGINEPLRDPQLREQELLRDYGLRLDNDEVNQGTVRRGANIIERFIGPLREGERRPGVKADSAGKRLVRGRGGVEVEDERDLPRKVVAMKGAVAPAAQIMQEELNRVQAGIDKYGADAFPGAADVVGRLEDDIKGNRDAERALVREMVQRDRVRQNAEAVEANNWRAQAAANLIGQDFMVGGRGAAADQAIANIGQIAKIGPAKVAADFQVAYPPASPEELNAPVTDNRFAGPLQKQQQFIVDNVGGYREGGAFGDYPQVDIGGQLGAARDAIAGIKGVDIGGLQIRNADDLQAAADLAIQQQAENNRKFYRREGKKNVYIENPAIIDVLQKARMNDREIGDVARALFAVEAARRQNVNQTKKELYAEGMGQASRPVEFGGNHPLLGGGAAKIDMIRGQKVEGKDVRAQLQALDGVKGNPGEPLNQAELAEARMPFQGAVKGEATRARFVRGEDRGLNEDQLIEKYGPANGKIAAQVVRRYEQQQGEKSDGFGIPLQQNQKPDEPMPSIQNVINPQPALPSSETSTRKQRPTGYLANFEEPKRQRTDNPSNAKRPFDGLRERFNRATTNQKIGAAVGGAVLGTLGLDALIGGEREKREEEAMR